jgi:purine nucleosidase
MPKREQRPQPLPPPGPAPAVASAARLCRRRGRDLTIVALGPLTNLALAVERDAAAVGGVRRVVAMGGAVDVPGNVTTDAEFNAHVDPKARDTARGWGRLRRPRPSSR